MTKPEYTIPAARRRDSVLECGSPLPLLLLRARLKSARRLAQSKTWRQADHSHLGKTPGLPEDSPSPTVPGMVGYAGK